ncbi:MAG: DUF3408 domain-containing protein [Draconibacterium sp.]
MSALDEKRIMELMGGEAPVPKSKASDKSMSKQRLQNTKTGLKKDEKREADFREVFFQRVELSDRQSIYLSRKTCDQLRLIVNGIGGNKASMSGYAECIINRHFEQYKEEIIRLFNENIKKPFQ